MTPEQLQMIRLTFLLVMDRRTETGRMFYERLFAVAPDTRALFGDDMDAQVQKLMDALAMAIASLRDMPSLVAMLEAMAVRHKDYGVRDEHYDQAGEALLWTLAAILGPAFTPAVRGAWATFYGTLANVMRDAAKQSVQPAMRLSA
jgi:hemoglobin-like flavoprotein